MISAGPKEKKSIMRFQMGSDCDHEDYQAAWHLALSCTACPGELSKHGSRQHYHPGLGRDRLL